MKQKAIEQNQPGAVQLAETIGVVRTSAGRCALKWMLMIICLPLVGSEWSYK